METKFYEPTIPIAPLVSAWRRLEGRRPPNLITANGYYYIMGSGTSDTRGTTPPRPRLLQRRIVPSRALMPPKPREARRAGQIRL